MADMNQAALRQAPRISVILPVYDRERLIGSAIDSILSQTEPDWELIIVDDGSTDSTGSICDRYAAEDSRISVLHVDNKGVSSARNAGMQLARGEWIAFLDSDDAYTPDAFRLMLDRSAGMDLVAASMRYAGSNLCRPLAAQEKIYSSWHETLEQDFRTLYDGFFYSSVCAKMYRRSLLRASFDPELTYAEDITFNLTVQPGLQRICVLPDCCYEYTYRLGQSHGQRAELMQLGVQKGVLARWRSVLCPQYMAQLSDVFQRYIKFVLKFIIKLLRSESLPMMYRTAILSAQFDSILVDERAYGFDRLPEEHQTVWRMLKGRDADEVAASLAALEALCFGRSLEVYRKDGDGQYRAIPDQPLPPDQPANDIPDPRASDASSGGAHHSTKGNDESCLLSELPT